MKKTKTKIEDIILTEEQIRTLRNIKENLASHSRSYQRRRIIGHNDCIVCGNMPTKKITIDVSDPEDDLKSYRIETYCSPCFERWVGSKMS